MRTTDERMDMIHNKVQDIKRKERRRKVALLSTLCIACPVILVAVSLLIGGAVPKGMKASYNYNGMAASLLANSPFLTLVVIAVVAFLLGITATLLCYKIMDLKKLSDDDGDENI